MKHVLNLIKRLNFNPATWLIIIIMIIFSITITTQAWIDENRMTNHLIEARDSVNKYKDKLYILSLERDSLEKEILNSKIKQDSIKQSTKQKVIKITKATFVEDIHWFDSIKSKVKVSIDKDSSAQIDINKSELKGIRLTVETLQDTAKLYTLEIDKNIKNNKVITNLKDEILVKDSINKIYDWYLEKQSNDLVKVNKLNSDLQTKVNKNKTKTNVLYGIIIGLGLWVFVK